MRGPPEHQPSRGDEHHRCSGDKRGCAIATAAGRLVLNRPGLRRRGGEPAVRRLGCGLGLGCAFGLGCGCGLGLGGCGCGLGCAFGLGCGCGLGLGCGCGLSCVLGLGYAFGLGCGGGMGCLFLLSPGKFCFRALSLQAGAFQCRPLPVLAFLLLADAFSFLLLADAFLFGAFLPLARLFLFCAFLGRAFLLLADAFLFRAFPFPLLLRGAFALRDALLLGGALLFLSGSAFLFLTGALLGETFPPGAFLRCALPFLRCALPFLRCALPFLPGAFLSGGPLALQLCGAFPRFPGCAFLLCRELARHSSHLPGTIRPRGASRRRAAVADLRTRNGSRRRQARHWCRVELRILVRQVPLRPAR